MIVLLYYLIGFLLFGMAEKIYPHDMSGITWFFVMLFFTSFWPFWLAYGIGNCISTRLKSSKGNEDESSESAE